MMNAITPLEQTAIVQAEQTAIANTATIKAISVPAEIASAETIKGKADAIYQAVADVTEVSDKAGREMIHNAAMRIREVRLDAKKSTADFEKTVKAQLKTLTSNINEAIEHAEQKEEKLLAIRNAFDEKQEQIKAAIKFAATAATTAAGQSAEQIIEVIERLNNTDVPGNAEFAIAKEKALSVLNTLREAAMTKEREAAEAAAAQQAEMKRLRAMEAELMQLRALQAKSAQQEAQPQATQKESNVVDVAFTEVKPASTNAQPEAQAPAEAPAVLNRAEVIDMVASLYMISTDQAEAALISMFGA